MLTIQQRIASSLKPVPPAEALGFGQHFTDHWFFAKYSEGSGWFDARIEPYGPFSLDPAASVLHYGQSLFEGMKAFLQPNGSIAIFRPEFNYQRMLSGAARMCLIPPSKELFMTSLRDLILVDARWVPTHPHCSLYIRPTLIGTEGFLGVRPSREILYYVILSPVGSYYANGSSPVKIYVEDTVMRAAPGGMGATKAGANYAASLRSAQDAKGKGFAQVLWLEADQETIQEVGTMNVFFVFRDEIVTPELNGNILAGSLRQSTIELLENLGQPVTVRRIGISEVIERLKNNQLMEAFGTGTAAVISPIGELSINGERHIINNNVTGPLSSLLYETITGIQRGLKPDKLNWMVPLETLT